MPLPPSLRRAGRLSRILWLGLPLGGLALAQPVAAADAPVPPSATAPTVLAVRAAGSLKAALTALARDFEAAEPGVRVELGFGASGLLKDRLMAGEAAEVFASANLAHPQALHAAGRSGPVQPFTANGLCALVAPGVALETDTLIDRLLDPALRVGTSTPRADPSGDYAWTLFERIDALPGRAGAAAVLKAKALQLTGGPASPPPPADRNVYGALVAGGQADVFLTYCTNATLARSEQPQLRIVAVPEALQVRADYGLVLLPGATPLAERFVAHLQGPAGQAVFRRLGFLPAAPAAPGRP